MPQTILRNVCSGRAHSCCNSLARFMLRRVRDKLYQDGAGLPPQGRTVRCPSLSPPARGTAPLWSVSLRGTSPGRVSSGGRPPDPRCGLRPQTGAWVLSSGCVFWGPAVLMPWCGLRPQAGCVGPLGVYGFWGRPRPRCGLAPASRCVGCCGGFAASEGGDYPGPQCWLRAQTVLWFLSTG